MAETHRSYKPLAFCAAVYADPLAVAIAVAPPTGGELGILADIHADTLTRLMPERIRRHDRLARRCVDGIANLGAPDWVAVTTYTGLSERQTVLAAEFGALLRWQLLSAGWPIVEVPRDALLAYERALRSAPAGRGVRGDQARRRHALTLFELARRQREAEAGDHP